MNSTKRGLSTGSRSSSIPAFRLQKRGDDVGPTKRGKGAKWLVVADGKGVPLACRAASGSTAEVKVAPPVFAEFEGPKDRPIPVIADRAYDSDAFRAELHSQGLELCCPHRRGRKRKATQDGRKLKRYRHHWIMERTIRWISNFRRLIVRHERYSFLYQGFLHLACILIFLRRF